jgi:diacylglycerol kinase
MKRFLDSRWRSFGHAFAGAWYLISSQPNAWIHAGASGVAIALGFTVHLNREEWCWIVAAIAIVWMMEALNTAIETVCDALTRSQHPKIRIAKDLGAFATLLAALFAGGVGALIFLPKLIPGMVG